jgi:hypothetical protein
MNEIVKTVKTVLKDDFGMKVSKNIPRLPSLIAYLAAGSLKFL